ncbi:MAG TPA: sigma factor, partial [Thermomicrobiales bacterium]|nr:sigma factor [Thermomicrobiales bacterium]
MQRTAVDAVSERRAESVPAEQFARLYDALFPSVYGYVRYRVGDQHVAEDLTALVFERALGRLTSVRQPEQIRAWIFTIARRAIADHYRARRPAATLDSVEALAHLWVDSPEVEALRRD